MDDQRFRTADLKAKPPRVSVCRDSGQEADATATKALLEAYTKEDGFHCPRCGLVIPNPEKAIEHLADEINQAFASLP